MLKLEAAEKNRATKQPLTPKIPQELWGFHKCLQLKKSGLRTFSAVSN
jgi:hypothetical protein